MSVIAVDVDDVCVRLMDVWLERYNKDWNDNLQRKDITDWNTTKFVKPECGGRIYGYLTASDLYKDAQPTEGALWGVEQLRKLGHRVVFATSTVRQAAGNKLDWLVEHGFCKMKYGSVCPDYIEVSDKSLVHADYLLDDRPENLDHFSGVSLLFDAPWNKTNTWYTRLMGWTDMVRIFNGWTYDQDPLQRLGHGK